MSLRNKYMKEAEAQLQEVARGGIDNKQEKREKTIRIRVWTYNELRKIGVMGMDFDDVITELIKEYKKRHAG